MKNKRFTFTLSKKTKEQLRFIAEQHNCSMAEAITDSVDEYTHKLLRANTYKEEK